MRAMPRLLLAALLLAGVSARAAECMRRSEEPVFDLAELKSQLMVTAISCKSNDRYNAFIRRFGPQLASNETALNGYFKRNFGRQGQKQHDEYITSLANAQSQQGLRQGSAFCSERDGMFDEVAALPVVADLSPYAEGKNLATPAALVLCADKDETGPTTRRHGRHSSARHAGRHGKHRG